MKNHHVLRALNQWLEVALARQRLQRFGKRMLHRGMAQAWNGWEEMLEERRRLQKFMRRMMQVNVGRAYSKWTELLGDGELAGRHMRGWLGFKHMKRMASAWAKWKAITEERMHRSRMLATHSRVVKAYRTEGDEDDD